MTANSVIVRNLGSQDYIFSWQQMQQFTQHREDHTQDEIWVLEHPPVFTQGQNGKPEHILDAGPIPVIQVDRGGQVTYHGPGQLVVYPLINLARKKLNVRDAVSLLEKSVMDLLADYQLHAMTKCKAPGVYIDEKKICSIGLRIRRGCSFHGLALNVAMDLTPFSRIHPCGFSGLEMTQLSLYQPEANIAQVGHKLVEYLIINLGYNTHLIETRPWHGPEKSQY